MASFHDDKFGNQTNLDGKTSTRSWHHADECGIKEASSHDSVLSRVTAYLSGCILEIALEAILRQRCYGRVQLDTLREAMRE